MPRTIIGRSACDIPEEGLIENRSFLCVDNGVPLICKQKIILLKLFFSRTLFSTFLLKHALFCLDWSTCSLYYVHIPNGNSHLLPLAQVYRQDTLSQKYSLFLFSKTSLSWNKHLHTSKSAFTLRQVTILIYFYNESDVTSTCGLYVSEHVAFEMFLKISILFQTCLCIILPLTNSSLLHVSKSLMVHCIPKSFSLFLVHNDTIDPSEAIP